MLLKQMTSVRGKYQRKLLLLLVVILTLLILKPDGEGDGRHYPPDVVNLPQELDEGTWRQPPHSHIAPLKLELEQLQQELLEEDVHMDQLSNLELDSEDNKYDSNHTIYKSWVKVKDGNRPQTQPDKLVDVEAFERPLAIDVDNNVLTDEAADFVGKLRAGTLNWPRNITIMTINCKMGPVFDIRFTLEQMGVNVIEHSFSPHCVTLGTCGEGLSIIRKDNAMTFGSEVVSSFHKKYSADRTFESVDAFLCVYPAAMCELFIPFNKSIIIFLETRYDIGRLEPTRLRSWTRAMMSLIEASEQHLVVSSNAYDSEYVRYFTNFAPHVMPPGQGYLKHAYSPSKTQFLLMPIRQPGFQDTFLKEFDLAVRENHRPNITLVPVSNLYHKHKHSDLAQHPALVIVPHQVSYTSLSEYYRMGIPMFLPSMELLTRWHLKYSVVHDKTWNERRRLQKRYGLFPGVHPLPNANDESTTNAIGFWLMFSDFYYQPHFMYYTSINNLVEKLATTKHSKLCQVSESMREFSDATFKKNIRGWQKIVRKLQKKKDSFQ